MNVSFDVNTVLSGIIIILTGAGLRAVFMMKTKLDTIQAWCQYHEKQDDERHEAVIVRLDKHSNKLEDFHRSGKKA